MADLGSTVGVLRAAGEGTRLRLLALLAHGELSVKDLTEILGQSQPRVSRHLKLLADAGLVARSAEGAWAYYRLAEAGSGADLARWLVERIDPVDREIGRDGERLRALRAAQQQSASAYFAEVAADWDALRRLHAPESAVEDAVLAAVGGRRFDFLLDLGTGTGRMLELLSGKYRRGLGVDSSREMLAVARARLVEAGIAHAQVRLGDIASLDPALGRADVIVIHQVLHYFDDPGRLLAQVRRMLRLGGELIVVDFAPHALEFLRTDHAHRRLGLSDAQMQAWARAADLTITSSQSIPNQAQTDGLTVCLWRLSDEPVSQRSVA